MELEEQLDMQQAANAASDSLCRSLRRRMQRLAGSLAEAQDALKERDEGAKHAAEKMASLQKVSEFTQRLKQSGEQIEALEEAKDKQREEMDDGSIEVER